MQGLDHAEDDPAGKYHNILVYTRPLTEQETRDYELDFIGEKQT